MFKGNIAGSWQAFGVLAVAMTTGCTEGGPKADSTAKGGTSSVGGAAAAGETSAGGDAAAAGASSGGASSTGGGSSTGGTSTSPSTIVVPACPTSGPPSPPPAPATTGVAKPSATVTAPNLKVLPWAGFKSAMTYTFDDTQPSQTEHWEELKAKGVPLTFFANPSGHTRAGYDAAWAAVADSGSELGNHTYNHCRADLTSCNVNLGSAEAELDATTNYLTENLHVACVYSFASPYGDANWNTYAKTRFLIGRGVMGGLVAPSGTTDWYNLPAIGIVAGQTVTNFNASIDAARTAGKWGIFLYHTLLPSTSNWYAGVQIADVTASIDYAKSLGDVWIDTFTAVGAYARAQQVFEAVKPTSNTWTWTLPAHFPPGKYLRVVVDGGTLKQGDTTLTWDSHGYYEVALDGGTLTWSP